MVEGPDSVAFKQHVDHVRDFMWMSKDGMMACGTFSLILEPPRNVSLMLPLNRNEW